MRILRVVAVLAAVVGLAWLTIGIGLANIMGSASPGTALGVYPFDARARANLAERGAVALMRRRDLAADVDHFARKALARDPTVVDAWRLIGVTAALRGNEEQATRTLRFAERISRRDLPVQLWLIEDQVRRDDVAGALRHYDIALRTAPTSRQLLFPILAAASAEPNVARPLLQILAANPAWRQEFTYHLTHSTITGDTLPAVVQQLAGTQAERDIMIPMVQRLITAGDYRNAWRVYRVLKRAPPAPPEPVRDGGFNAVPAVAPFDWFMSNEGAIRAERRIRENSAEDAALYVAAEAGSSGDGARQLMLLEPGSYLLSAVIGSVVETTPAGVELQVACLGVPPRVLTRGTNVPSQQSGQPQRLRFTVPAGCRAQMLTIAVRSGTDVGASEAWIDNVSVSRP